MIVYKMDPNIISQYSIFIYIINPDLIIQSVHYVSFKIYVIK